jgi:radical SAM superfamily enzyme YgiQ (UPF0313 family)
VNILLIYPPVDNQAVYSKRFRRIKGAQTSAYPPLGLMYLQAVIRRETSHRISLIDLTIQAKQDFDLESYIEEQRPDLVGMTAYTLCFYDVLRTARAVKSVDSNIKIVLGGPHIDLYSSETMVHPEIDFAIAGDGEIPFLELVKAIEAGQEEYGNVPALFWLSNDDRLRTNEQLNERRPLDSFPFPSRDNLETGGYFNPFFPDRNFANVSTSRGCPFSCTFCDVTDKRFRSRSIANVVDEIESIYKKYHTRNFFIVDDLFNISMKRVSDFCREVLKRGLDIRWIFRGRVDQINAKLLQLCKKSGCIHIIFGVEDFTDKGLRMIQKKITTRQVLSVFNLSRKYRIKTTANFIIGFPHHRSAAEVMSLNGFIKRLKPDYLQLGILIPFPGSRIFAEGVKRGIIDPNIWTDYIKRPVPNFEMPLWEQHMNLTTLTMLYERILKSFYLSPWQIWRRIIEVRSWHQFLAYVRIGLATLRSGRLDSNETVSEDDDAARATS